MFGVRCSIFRESHLGVDDATRVRPDVVKEWTDEEEARCSNKDFLPMSTTESLSLLDWTARQVRSDKWGSTPQEFAPLFQRLGDDGEWLSSRLLKGESFSGLQAV